MWPLNTFSVTSPSTVPEAGLPGSSSQPNAPVTLAPSCRRSRLIVPEVLLSLLGPAHSPVTSVAGGANAGQSTLKVVWAEPPAGTVTVLGFCPTEQLVATPLSATTWSPAAR